MGKLQFIQETVARLDNLYKLADAPPIEIENGGLYSKKIDTKSKSKLAGKEVLASSGDTHPEVYEMFQAEILKDGSTVHKPFKPLAYSLLCWIKSQGYPDQIDLSDDSDRATYSFTMDSHGDFKYSCYFELIEEAGLAMYYMYFYEENFDVNDFETIKLLVDINQRLNVGQFQYVDTEDGAILRYFASICMKDIASEDPQYSGPFQIHPNVFENLVSYGRIYMNRYSESFRERDIDTIGVKLSDSPANTEDDASNSSLDSWVSAASKPDSEGEYEVTSGEIGWPLPMPPTFQAHWKKGKWLNSEGNKINIKYWRKI
jgi:hypothetical protein